jgi:hypothetical protein
LSVELVQPLRGVRGRSWLEDRELGDANQMIRLAVAEIPAVREAMPADMPQPIRLRVTNRF